MNTCWMVSEWVNACSFDEMTVVGPSMAGDRDNDVLWLTLRLQHWHYGQGKAQAELPVGRPEELHPPPFGIRAARASTSPASAPGGVPHRAPTRSTCGRRLQDPGSRGVGGS